jgi:hypothetical protein
LKTENHTVYFAGRNSRNTTPPLRCEKRGPQLEDLLLLRFCVWIRHVWVILLLASNYRIYRRRREAAFG